MGRRLLGHGRLHGITRYYSQTIHLSSDCMKVVPRGQYNIMLWVWTYIENTDHKMLLEMLTKNTKEPFTLRANLVNPEIGVTNKGGVQTT